MTERPIPLYRQLATTGRDLLCEALATCLPPFKIILTISVVTWLLQQWGLVDQIGALFKCCFERPQPLASEMGQQEVRCC